MIRLHKTIMDYDEDKVDEMVLALLYRTTFNEQGFVRAWKGHDWAVLKLPRCKRKNENYRASTEYRRVG
jgi:hypothetical protein